MVTKGRVIMVLWKQLAQVVLVTTIVYLLFLLVTKFMGRKTISGMTMFDFIAGVTMGSLGGGFIIHYFKGSPVSIVALLVMGVLVVLTGEVSLVSLKIRRILTGEPMVVIRNWIRSPEKVPKWIPTLTERYTTLWSFLSMRSLMGPPC